MDLETYLALKLERSREQTLERPHQRPVCTVCHKSSKTCYCARIKPFVAGPRFIILIHPKEFKKSIGTGRLSHLCIRNSELIEGIDFTDHKRVKEILADRTNWPVVLYPGPDAVDISGDAGSKVESQVPAGKTLVIFVIDGSWSCAQKMLRVSANLRQLPQIRFTPTSRSTYKIRRQPRAACFSSLEAVHFVIEQFNGSSRWRSDPGHDNLLEVFSFMIEQQLSFLAHPQQKAKRGIR